MLHLVVGNKNYSSWSLRAWLALAEIGAPFDETVIPLYVDNWSEKILKHSKAGLVPILHDGDVTIWDSLAICEYLAERHPALWPVEGPARAHARSVSAEMHSGFAALRDGGVGRSVPISPEIDRDVRRFIEVWGECRTRFGGGNGYLYGDFTIADAMFAPVISRLGTYGITLDGVAQAYSDTVWDSATMRTWRAASEAEPWVTEKYKL